MRPSYIPLRCKCTQLGPLGDATEPAFVSCLARRWAGQAQLLAPEPIDTRVSQLAGSAARKGRRGAAQALGLSRTSCSATAVFGDGNRYLKLSV